MKKYHALNKILLDRKALLSNIQKIEWASHLPTIPVLKSNAYGHGLRQIAGILSGKVDMIAVDGFYEAHRARRHFRGNILVLGAIDPRNLSWIPKHKIHFAIGDLNTLQSFINSKRKWKIHLEIDTGMNRMGFDQSEIPEIKRLLASTNKLEVTGIMTHLAATSNKTFTHQQVRTFDQCVKGLDLKSVPYIHISSSGGTLVTKSQYATHSRPGLSIYGFDEAGIDGLKPVMQITSQVAKIQHIRKGESVGYERSFIAPHDMRVAVLPFGYYEGTPRGCTQLANHQILGLVCMNHIMIAGRGLKLGDTVTVFDDAATFAKDNHLFTRALLTGINENIRREIT